MVNEINQFAEKEKFYQKQLHIINLYVDYRDTLFSDFKAKVREQFLQTISAESPEFLLHMLSTYYRIKE